MQLDADEKDLLESVERSEWNPPEAASASAPVTRDTPGRRSAGRRLNMQLSSKDSRRSKSGSL